ncbi:MAG TPA: hypothetical protein VJ011_12270, partial [Steroidobacteraceae bacterium]|nr:hypothetical protein [Steroidobacteraceae bacterium]
TWRALLDAPTGAIAFIASYNKALWSPDSRHVILLNSMLPLGEPGRSTTSYVVDYDIRHGTWAILDSLTPTPDRRIADMEWLDPGRSVVVRRFSAVATGPAPEKKIFTLENGTWAPKTASADSAEGKAVPDDLAATIREGLNMPPVVVATYKGRQIQLTPEDPVVAAARRARIEVVEWRDRTGAAWTGGLTLPSAKPRAGKIPLVVQIYDFMPDRFLPDGVSTTAFAMQPLAARGIAVLQMSMPRVIVNEGPPFVEAVDSAAEMAAERYGIDPAKVGLLGFSRSGGRTSYAVTHPGRTKLAAALVADGGDANYALYLNYAATYPNIAKTAQGTLEAINGGTFWANKAAWLERAPGFNLDRVETPLLITSTGPFSFLVVNEMYTGLQILKKPIDVIMFPEGAHQLMMPRERLASMEATVDWMSYWLQGSKDPQPGKAAQYKRWDALRALRDGAQPAKAN